MIGVVSASSMEYADGGLAILLGVDYDGKKRRAYLQ